MSEEKLYAVKNDDGDWVDPFYVFGYGAWATPDKAEREEEAKHNGGHVVTLIEASKPVEVSENEAKMLATLMDGDLMPVSELSYFVRHAEQLPEKESIEREDRLMRAYVNGYTVAKEKRYLVGLDGLVTTDGAKQYLTNKGGKWFASRIQPSLHQAFTGEELNNAPEWVKQLNREEVTDDDD